MPTRPRPIATDVADAVVRARAAQPAWAALPLPRRLTLIRAARHALAAQAQDLARTVSLPGRTPADTLTAEVMPLCDAARFLERTAPAALKVRHLGRRGRPGWLWGVRSQLQRDPLGVVLILAPFNYPLLLPGVQMLQALAAGNAVIVKPGREGFAAAAALADVLHRAGVPREVLVVLDESVEAGEAAIDAGVDKVFLTGSVASGRAVMAHCSEHLTPLVCELSGDDPAIVLGDADIDLARRCIAWGASLNGGHTCIAPRRVIAHRDIADRLRDVVGDLPLVVVEDDDAAVRETDRSDLALGASVFGSTRRAMAVARQLRCGCVTVNDVIVPTADPRLPFGGRRRSGFGKTRGFEGLLEMTVTKTISTRRAHFRPHLDPSQPGDEAMFTHAVRMSHGQTPVTRIRAAASFMAAALRRKQS